MKLALLLPLFFLLGLKAPERPKRSPSCSDLDILATNPKLKSQQMKQHFSTPRNQDSMGWCYAFAAADLLSAELGTPVSSLHVSLLFNEHVQENVLNHFDSRIGLILKNYRANEILTSGYADIALMAAFRNKWVCPENKLPFDRQYGETKTLLKDLEKLKSLQLNDKLSQDQLCQELQSSLPLHGIQIPDYKSLAKTFIEDELNQTMAKIAQTHCSGKGIAVPKLMVKTLTWDPTKRSQKKKDAMKTIDQVLNKGKPLSVVFNMSAYAPFASDEFNHVITVVGRRWKNDRCEYKIRNSWGKGCGSFHRDIDCLPEEGSFWISGEDLGQSGKEISYIP
jgi:hypothetical protein